MKRCWLEIDRGTDLGALDASVTPGLDDGEDEAREETESLRGKLVNLQRRLHAEGARSLLVVFQAMDAGGKDGAIRRIFSGVNPQGVRVKAFKAPSPEERAHDFLWRVHPHVPAAGEIAVFNRSHYEDVVAVRARGLAPQSVWRPRQRHIRAFESMLADSGTRILKFFLHIDRDEQRRRLQERVDDPSKWWKFDPGDLDDRARWDDYMAAYRDAIVCTHRPHAPWYVIPANRKWFRDLAVLRVLVATLEEMEPREPPAKFDPSAIVIA